MEIDSLASDLSARAGRIILRLDDGSVITSAARARGEQVSRARPQRMQVLHREKAASCLHAASARPMAGARASSADVAAQLFPAHPGLPPGAVLLTGLKRTPPFTSLPRCSARRLARGRSVDAALPGPSHLPRGRPAEEGRSQDRTGAGHGARFDEARAGAPSCAPHLVLVLTGCLSWSAALHASPSARGARRS